MLEKVHTLKSAKGANKQQKTKHVRVKTLSYAQICAMYVDGIIHHALVESIFRDDLALARREVCCICLSCEVSLAIAQSHVEVVEIDVIADLRQESHALGIVNRCILDMGILASIEENSRRWAHIGTHGDNATLDKTLICFEWGIGNGKWGMTVQILADLF